MIVEPSIETVSPVHERRKLRSLRIERLASATVPWVPSGVTRGASFGPSSKAIGPAPGNGDGQAPPRFPQRAFAATSILATVRCRRPSRFAISSRGSLPVIS